MNRGTNAAKPEQSRPGRVHWALTCLALATANCLAAVVWRAVPEAHPELSGTLLHRVAAAAYLVLGWPTFLAFIIAVMYKVVDPVTLAEQLHLFLALILGQWVGIWVLGWSVPVLWRKDVRRTLLALWLLCGAWLCVFASARQD